MYAAERKEREAQAVFRTTLYSIGDAVITTDAGQRVTALNRVAEELTGWSDAEARGRQLSDVYRTVDELTREPRDPVAQTGRPGGDAPAIVNHTLLLRRGGDERPIASSAAPIVDAVGMVHGTVMVFRDQTEEKAQEQRMLRAERLAGMGRMAGGIAHDFNNVLSVISGAVRWRPAAAQTGIDGRRHRVVVLLPPPRGRTYATTDGVCPSAARAPGRVRAAASS